MTSMPTELLRQEAQGAVAILTLDNPAQRNALARPLQRALADALDRIEADRSVRAVVLTGAEGNFSAGGDLAAMQVADFAAGRERFRLPHGLVRQMVKSAKPIVAAVEGWCVGAGLSVALCCDTIVAAEGARFMASFGRVGLMADMGMLHTLPLRVGMGRARQMMLYGQAVAAVEAERIGLADRLTPPGEALDVAIHLAAALAESAPLPIATTKAFLAQGLDAALDWEREAQSALFQTADFQEGRDAFLQKRAPRFTGA